MAGVLLLCAATAMFLVFLVAWAAHKKSKQRACSRINVRVFGAPEIRVRPRLRCPYCHDSITGQTYECKGCKAVYHTECLEEARGCTTLGCAHAAPRRTVRV